jgi:multiple sugar transport system substrate-binding protein
LITLRGITWDHPRGLQPLSASAPVYERQFGVHIEWEARSLKDFGDAPITQLAEQYDLLIIDHPHVGQASASARLVPLEGHISPGALNLLAQQSAGPSHASYLYEGHQWALAVDAAVQASAYRPDLFSEEQPQNWDSVFPLGERAIAKGKRIALPLAPTDCICSFLSLCASLGDPPAKQPDSFVSEAVGMQALELLRALKQVAHPGSITWNPIGMLNHMSSTDEIVYCPLTFIYTNYSRDGFAPNLITFGNISGVEGACLGGAGIAVSAGSQHVEEAVAYSVWICSDEVQRTLYVREGGQPGNRAAWEDQEANRITHRFFANTYNTLMQAYVRPRYSYWAAFQEEAGILIYEYLQHTLDETGCLKRMRELYKRSLGL